MFTTILSDDKGLNSKKTWSRGPKNSSQYVQHNFIACETVVKNDENANLRS